MQRQSWSGYLAGFHDARPAVTERVLRRAGSAVGHPYAWLLAAVPDEGSVLDLACGSAPLWPALTGRPYLGVDSSAAELRVARARGADVARASADALPVPTGGVDVVTCSMGLQVVQPLADVLGEVGRVLAPGGRLVATLPADGPLRPLDIPAVAGLLTALGRRLDYPNDAELRRLSDLLAAADLRPVADERRRFTYRLDDTEAAEQFLGSLYLPGIGSGRYAAARRWLHVLARARAALPVPIRRLVAVRG